MVYEYYKNESNVGFSSDFGDVFIYFYSGLMIDKIRGF